MPNPMLQTRDTPIYRALIERHRYRDESKRGFCRLYVQVVVERQDLLLTNLPLHNYRIVCSRASQQKPVSVHFSYLQSMKLSRYVHKTHLPLAYDLERLSQIVSRTDQLTF